MINLSNSDLTKIKSIIEAAIEIHYSHVNIHKLDIFKDGRIIISFEHGVSEKPTYELADKFVGEFIRKGNRIDGERVNEFLTSVLPKTKFPKEYIEKALKDEKFTPQDAKDLANSADIFHKAVLNVINNKNSAANKFSKDFAVSIDEWLQARYSTDLKTYNESPDERLKVLDRL